MKYIIFEKRGPILFGDHVTHHDVFSRFSSNDAIVSAGFVRITSSQFIQSRGYRPVHVVTNGKSISLDVVAHEEDASEIAKLLK